MSQLPIKSRVIEALLAGDTTVRAICARTGLQRSQVAPVVCVLHRDGAIVVTERYGHRSGGSGRPGHIYALAGAANG